MYVEWDNEYQVGMAVFDEQHKKLFAVINQLHEGIRSGESRDFLEDIFNGLLDYTMSHFRDEETLMEEKNYPFLDEHKKEHEELLQKVIAWYEDYHAGKGIISSEVMNILVTWLKNHILTSDKKYGPYICDVNVENCLGSRLVWDKTFSVDIPAFDTQHREIFALLNEFIDLVAEGAGVSRINNAYESLIDFTQAHFAEEEKAMRENDYPFLEKHMASHAAILRKTIEFHDNHMRGDIVFTNEIAEHFATIYKQHILDEDRDYGPFLVE